LIKSGEFIPFGFFDFHENIVQIKFRIPARIVEYHACWDKRPYRLYYKRARVETRTSPIPAGGFKTPAPAAPARHHRVSNRKWRLAAGGLLSQPSDSPYGTTAAGIPLPMGPRGGIYNNSIKGRKVYDRKGR
jgi:hypothetical protein